MKMWSMKMETEQEERGGSVFENDVLMVRSNI